MRENCGGMMWRIVAVGGVSASIAALWKCQKQDATYCSSMQTGVEAIENSPYRASDATNLSTMPSPYLEAIAQSRKLICRSMIEQGIPGAVVCVTVDGNKVWSEGIGYADIENDVTCSSQTVMRIASISKCLTAVAVMQLWEDGLLDLDAPVQSYVPLFPYKTFDGKEVKITCRKLLCHTAGVRHYKKASDIESNKEEFHNDEYFIKEHYASVSESLKLFSNDDLLYAPGTKFYYTTHGWTLLSAVIEGVSGMPFLDYLQKFILSPLHMDGTGPEKNNPLLYNRARYCMSFGDMGEACC
ncbi:Serine beta-lactamase-like protein LACTB, mitochondrial [Geodia barretti]|uniref:Serine beta-lactamase-like protein LACTB, mitochondrial n=1 Tax=Geodia barretti TaxID=519541 RepID=A0AA35SMG9_GEOBA|nr:Serine beta-lactamase-like protein LACTB, mitochondrial [Geodia barretti]